MHSFRPRHTRQIAARGPARLLCRGQRFVMVPKAQAAAQCWQQTIFKLQDATEAVGATAMFTGAAAAFIQGTSLPDDLLQTTPITMEVQWDAFLALHHHLAGQQPFNPGSVEKQPGGRQQFAVRHDTSHAVVSCELNRVVAMNPHRVAVQHCGRQLWCESLLLVRSRCSGGGSSSSSSQASHELAAQVTARLQQLQAELTAANAEAWSQAEAGDAWLAKVGQPQEAADRLRNDPLLRLGSQLAKHLPQQLTGCRLINLMSSHCTKGVACALLGATVTCVDISPINLAYRRQLAAAAGVGDRLMLVQADVLQLPAEHLTGGYDVVLMELGVLHYFVDLAPLMSVVARLLRPGGRFVLREFHPASTKLLSSKGKKHKVAPGANYFSQELRATEVAYSKYAAAAAAEGGAAAAGGGDGPGKPKQQVVRLRQWALGEVVTAAAAAGLVVQQLEEEPGVKAADHGLPKLFTLVAIAGVTCTR